MLFVFPLATLGLAFLADLRPDGFDRFGQVPAPLGGGTGAQTLQQAGLAGAGSWTRRNILQAGSAGAYSRRLGGTATEADFAVIRAARPGIASGQSGTISPSWTGAPWPGEGSGPGLDLEGIGDAVAAELVETM